MGALVAAAVGLSLIVVAALSRPRAAALPDTSRGGTAAPPSPRQPQPPTAGDVIGQTVGVVAAAVPAIVPLVTAATAGGGGAALAAGGSSATVAGTVTTTSAAAGGGGAGAAGAVGSGVAGASLGASIAGPGIIVGVVMLFVIAEKIAAAQENDKDWQSYLYNLGANAHGLNRFEGFVAGAWAKEKGWGHTIKSVRDTRMDRVVYGSRVKFQGWAGYLVGSGPTTNAQGGFTLGAGALAFSGPSLEVKRKVRGMAMRYLRHRSRHAYAMMRAWGAAVPADFGVSEAALWSQYNDAVYRADEKDATHPFGPLGGLLNVPSAFGGQTVTPRRDPAEETPSRWELIGNEVNGEFRELVGDTEEKAARFIALVDALKVLRWDPRPGIEADGAVYAANVHGTLNSLSPLEGVALAGEELALDAGVYGLAAFINPRKLKLRESGAIRL